MGDASSAIGDVTRTTPLVDMAKAYARSRVVCAAARLEIADALADGERSAEELAAACQADAGSLHRLLRAMACLGLTGETSPGRFVLTALGQPLRKDAPNSAWAAVVFWADLLADSWSYLTDCVRTGQTAARLMEARGITSRWAQDPNASDIFRAVMGTAPAENYLPIARSWGFTGRKVVADLGGGGGALLSAVLKSHPGLRGMLVDRPESLDTARPHLAREGVADRCQLVAADLAETVPPGADVAMLKHVLHGYTDDVASRILHNCRAALPADGVLLVIEFVLPDVVTGPDPGLEGRLMSDLNMMAVTGGRERSTGEWTRLLAGAGFSLDQIIPVPGNEVSIIEARPTR